MGLFTYAVTGGAIFLIGAWECFVSASEALVRIPPSPASLSPSLPSSTQSVDKSTKQAASISSTVPFLSIFILSIFAIINSLLSLLDAVKSRDNMGFALQLEVITISLLFLLYSGLGTLTNTCDSFAFPLPVLNFICAFAFGEEFLLFHVHSKDPTGIENRYYDLLLVPIAICLFSTILELKNPKSSYPRLGRGIGLILQGMWILQMGLSFYSNLISNGCSLQEKSRGNYTVKCKGHPEYHRGRAIATLQFNCHLALLVTFLAGAYSFMCRKHGISSEFMRYKPIGYGEEMNHSRFTLDSDDEDDNGDRVKESKNVEMQKTNMEEVRKSAGNGYNLPS